ncbi:MAG: hypothetical protein FWH44_03730 [Methanomassiliicoccaceae archaeon]|nr:hypothetical protein [Methanomassiliicoccaceae archaeon]
MLSTYPRQGGRGGIICRECGAAYGGFLHSVPKKSTESKEGRNCRTIKLQMVNLDRIRNKMVRMIVCPWCRCAVLHFKFPPGFKKTCSECGTLYYYELNQAMVPEKSMDKKDRYRIV